MRYIFAWDPGKAKDNLRNHRISFERAATIFRDPQALSIFDTAHSDQEDRWITLGLDRSGSVLVVVHTFYQIRHGVVPDTYHLRLESHCQGNEAISRGATMKQEYDFSGGERGKFYHAEAELAIPVYLDPDVAVFVQKVAAQKGVDVATLVNDWLRKDMAFLETVMP